MLVSSPAAKQYDLSFWKVIIGGARLPKSLALEAMKMGIQIYAAYGMSETCPLLTAANLKPWMLKDSMEQNVDTLVKTGLPAPLVYVRLKDPLGKDMPHDGVSKGEVCVRTPWLSPCYYKDPERTKDLWVDGWLHTGDVGVIDTEGYLQVTDRIKDVIKTGGEWISSQDLENLVANHEAVVEAAAIGIPDDKWGERPFLVAVLKPDFVGKVTGDDLRQYVLKASEAGKIPKYGVPDRIEIVESIPKTSVGKINKVELRKAYII